MQNKAVTKTKEFSVEITATTATYVNIFLEYFTEGVGTFNITIKWPQGCPTLHHINWSINSASAAVKSGTIQLLQQQIPLKQFLTPIYRKEIILLLQMYMKVKLINYSLVLKKKYIYMQD